MLGRTVSHYRVREKLGSGGMGEVYLADDLDLDRPVALKFLGPRLLHEKAAARRLQREARAIARLSHPNIATVHELVTAPDETFLVLEYVRGKSLAERIAEGRFTLEECVRVGIGVARGLAEAHAHGLVHRDVKPDNVMLTERGDVKILDFGLARSPVAGRRALDSLSAATARAVVPESALYSGATGLESTLDIQAGISGTLAYMAPEQLSGAAPDPTMDVYALGGLLFELCTGKRPFAADDVRELVRKILGERIPRPGQLEPALPRDLERLIEDCLEKEPTHRPGSARLVAEQLEAIEQRLRRRHDTGPRTLAVLPFVDMSPEHDQDYFCDGITEELILGLTRVADLEVASRTSAFGYKNSVLDIRRIGQELGVGSVLEGSVRKAGDRVRIAAVLVDVSTGHHLWSESFDRQLRDILTVQDEIAGNIVRALEITLHPGESMPRVVRRARDPEAYDYYLRGRRFFFQYDRRSMELALTMFRLAIEHDEDFALAYTGVANAWAYLFLYSDRRAESLAQAGQSSRKALELDPELAEAHVAQGQVLSLSEWHDEAEQAFRAALDIDPRLFEAAYLYARDCFARGRLEQAAELFGRAQVLDPHDYQSAALLGMVYDGLGDPERAESTRRHAVALVEEHLKRHPGDVRALYMGANCLISLGERRRSLEWARLARSIEPDDPMVLYNLACVHAKAGEVENALECLDRAVKGGLVQRGWIENDSDLDPVRAHPAFQGIMDWLEARSPRDPVVDDGDSDGV